jgi:hypothetical protein
VYKMTFFGHQFKHSSDIEVITSTIWETGVLVLLMGGIYELCR